MVDFVFDHQPQPFPFGDFHSAWGFAFGLQIRVAKRGEDFQRFPVQAVHQSQDIFIAVGELFAVAPILAGLPLQIFSPKIAFGDREVPQEIAKREFSRRVSPIELVGRDATRYAHGAFADGAKVVEERFDGLDFHEDLHCSLPELNNRRPSASECCSLSPVRGLWQIPATPPLYDLDRPWKTLLCFSEAREPSAALPQP